jgi:hypothetical protein
MTVEVEGRKKYRVVWFYDISDNLIGSYIQPKLLTTCVIQEYISNEEVRDLTIAVITKYYKDIYDKNLARKISLTKALLDAATLEKPLGKKERTEIWKAYYKMRNNKW